MFISSSPVFFSSGHMIAVFHSPLSSPMVSDKFTMVVIESRHAGNISLSMCVGTVSSSQDLDFIDIMVLHTCLLVSGAKYLNYGTSLVYC